MNYKNSTWTPPLEKFLSNDEVKQLLTKTEERAIIDKAKGRKSWIRKWLLVNILINTGLRVSEAADLRVGNLNLKSKEPSILIEHGKGQKKRWVYVSKDLAKHLKLFLIFKKRVRESVEEDSFILCNKKGDRLSTRTLQLAFKICLKNAGLDTIKYTVHSCRHTYASQLYKKSKDLRLTQTQLGHSSPSITCVYANLNKEYVSHQVNGIFD